MVRTGRRLILIVNIYFFDRGCLCDLCALIFEINVRYYSQNMISQIMFTHGKHAEKRQNDMVSHCAVQVQQSHHTVLSDAFVSFNGPQK